MTTITRSNPTRGIPRDRLVRVLRMAVLWLMAAFTVACGGGGGAEAPEGSDSAPLSFAAHPVDTRAVAGETATLTVAVDGDANVQWQRLLPDGWFDLAGAQSAHYTLPAVLASDNGAQFRVVATSRQNPAQRIVSSVATLTLYATANTPAITVQPVAVSSGEAQDISFSVTAAGDQVRYQWQVSVDGGATFANVNGGTGPSLALSFVTLANDGWQVRVIVTNDFGSTVSAVVPVRVMRPPEITLQPETTTWRPGQMGALFIAAASGRELRYQWQLSRDGVSWADAPGVTGTSYAHAANADASTSAVRVVVSNPGGSTTSNAAGLRALPWQLVSPTPTGTTLAALTWLDANTVFASGTEGTILRSTDAGASWTLVSEGHSGSTFRTHIAFNAQGIGVSTMGPGGAIMRSTDGGLQWAAVRKPSTYGSGAVAATNAGAFCLADENGVILCSPDAGLTWLPAVSDTYPLMVKAIAFNADGVGLIVGKGGVMLRSTDGGARWARIGNTGGDLAAVAFATRDVAFAAGANGTLMRSGDAGQTWQAAGSGTAQDIVGMHFGSASRGALLLADSGIRLTTDAGANWTAANVPSIDAPLHAVSFGPGGDAVAVGMYGNILRSTDGGRNWTRVTGGGYDQGLTDVAFSTPDNGIAVGHGGRVLRSKDAGRTWTLVASGGTPMWTAAGFFDATTGVTLGIDGSISRTVDGGSTWAPVASATTVQHTSFARVDATTGVVATATGLLRSTDAGTTWMPIPGTGSVYASAVAFNAARTGLAVGDGGRIYRSVDGGLTWSAAASATGTGLKAVAFASENVAVAVGVDGVVVRSTDAGITWQAGLFPFFTGSWYYGVTFTTPTTGVAVGGLGVTMVTRDGGVTWELGSMHHLAAMSGLANAGARGVVAVGSGGVIALNEAP